MPANLVSGENSPSGLEMAVFSMCSHGRECVCERDGETEKKKRKTVSFL